MRFPAETQICHFDGESLVFNPLSWETHLLNVSAAEVVSVLSEGPQYFDILVGRMREAGMNVQNGVSVEDQLEGLLIELESLGIAIRSL
ncbi:MAG TPA: HPr-rel-A system PqqD family peptide chaperone [Burkholderiales bacterium]|nr:HPr-rel-A system PqqD family peptide chaperone [Burkholderiales bacterium]